MNSLSRARCVPLSVIEALACEPAAGCLMVFAGRPQSVPAPQGVATIMSYGGNATIGAVGGLTKVKSAAAFTAPSFTTKNVPEGKGHTAQHFAEVEQTQTADVTHDCYFPGPGDHIRTGMMSREGNQMVQHYYRVTQQISELIKAGEEEHLADAQRAYEITYKLIADTINAMAGQRFGPARTPNDAYLMAEAELGKRLPAQLGTNPLKWPGVLDRLLKQTEERDRQGWHSISAEPPFHEHGKILHKVFLTSAKIGVVPSTQVVNY